MKTPKLFKTCSLALVILGIAMIYIGGFYGASIILPPIITGIGFFIIAWIIYKISETLN
jgi:glucose dehydrogenase